MLSSQPAPLNNPSQIEVTKQIHKSPMDVTPGYLIGVNIINSLTHICLGAVIFSAFSYVFIIKYINKPVWWYWIDFYDHIYFCMVGYGILISHAILEFNPYVGWGAYLQPSQKRIISLIMQILGSGLAITGGMMKFFDRTLNFNSTHGYVGFIAMILTIANFVGGVIGFIKTRSNRPKGSAFDLAHATFTILTLATAFSAVAIAFHVHYRLVFIKTATNVSISMTVLTMLGFIILIFVKHVRIV